MIIAIFFVIIIINSYLISRDISLFDIVLSIIAAFILSFITMMLVGSFFSVEYQFEKEQPIYAIADEDYLCISQALTPKINYTIKTKKGYSIKAAPTENSYIKIIKDKSKPRVAIYRATFSNIITKIIFITPCEPARRIFYVPENSVSNKYIIKTTE
jgi:hypothetical protein